MTAVNLKSDILVQRAKASLSTAMYHHLFLHNFFSARITVSHKTGYSTPCRVGRVFVHEQNLKKKKFFNPVLKNNLVKKNYWRKCTQVYSVNCFLHKCYMLKYPPQIRKATKNNTSLSKLFSKRQIKSGSSSTLREHCLHRHQRQRHVWIRECRLNQYWRVYGIEI